MNQQGNHINKKVHDQMQSNWLQKFLKYIKFNNFQYDYLHNDKCQNYILEHTNLYPNLHNKYLDNLKHTFL